MNDLATIGAKPDRIARDEIDFLEERALNARDQAQHWRGVEKQARSMAQQYETNVDALETSISRLKAGSVK